MLQFLNFYSALLLIFLIAAALTAFYFWWRFNRRRKIKKSLDLKLFSIKLPIVSDKDQEKKVIEEINISEQLFSSLTAFKNPFIFEVAVPYLGEEICFYAAVPFKYGEALKRQIQSLWKDAEVIAVDDYNIFNYGGFVSAGFIKQKEGFAMPLRTYREADSDTFLSILGGLTKVAEVGEGAALQFIVKPASHQYKKSAQSVLNLLRKGKSLKEALKSNVFLSLEDFKSTLSPSENKKEEKTIDETAIKALELKLTKSFFEVNVRIFASAPSQYQADSIFESIAAGFSQFSAPYRNEFKIIKPSNNRGLVHRFSFREFNKQENVILNSEELVSIFHLPPTSSIIPKVKYLRSKEAPPPPDLPAEGLLLGLSLFREETKEIKFADRDRGRHLYMVGQTGTGKSNLITHMVADDIAAGKGLAVIDPHGDLIENLLSLIPKKRFEDVIFFDPSDLEMPLGINMIEYDISKPEQKTFIINEMVGIFDKLYDLKVTGGPMFEQYMRNALLLLMEDSVNEPATLMEVPRVFTDGEFRNRKLQRIYNPTVIDFWEKEAIKAGGEAALANITPYITSKFNTFTANDYMRAIIGQVNSAFNFRKVMDEGKILLINLSKGRIGDINANLLGMIFVGKILMAALSRVDLPEKDRRDFYLYIDEFQNFTTESIATILSEARKYRLNLIIAHQFIAQISEKIRDAVFGNVGSMISFRVGVQDAEFLVKQFEPVFNQNDLINIENFSAYIRLMINGQIARPFKIRTIKSALGNYETPHYLKELSRQKYGRQRSEVEAEIYNRLRG